MAIFWGYAFFSFQGFFYVQKHEKGWRRMNLNSRILKSIIDIRKIRDECEIGSFNNVSKCKGPGRGSKIGLLVSFLLS